MPPKHPFGYARIEYITRMVVSLVVFLLGINLLTSSVNKIMHPTAPEATILAYVIMLVSVAINVVVYSVNRRVGKIIQSVAISAAATKNIIDGIASFVVVCALGVFSLWGVDLDGYVGLMMSLLIIYSAATSLRDTVNPLLCLMPSEELLYLFFTITIPRGTQIDGDILRKELQSQLQKLNKNYTAAIRVNYSHVLL